MQMMASKDTLDQPEEKRLSGLDLKINRYHIINPDTGELMITELPSKGYSWIWVCLTCCGVGMLMCWVAYHVLRNEDSVSGAIVMILIGLFVFFLGCFAVFKKFFSKKIVHFTPAELIVVSTFGKKKIYPKEKVRSVFLHRTDRYVNNVYEGSDYNVCLRISGPGNDIQFRLTDISNEDTEKGLWQSSSAIRSGAETDATKIAALVAEHWQIPFKI